VISLVDHHEWEWRESVARKAPLAEQNALLRRWLDTRGGADSVLDCIPRLNKRYMRPNHMRQLAGLFPRAEVEPLRVVSSVPPRHSKTETLSYGLIGWYMARNPEKLNAYISYSADIAESKSRGMREIARRAGIHVNEKNSRLGEWRNSSGGGVLATGVGGPLTGFGIDGIMIIDDPVKNREEAESPTVSRKNHEWLTSTAMTRLEPGASVIVNMTRWSMIDIAGLLIDDKESQWEYIVLPAISESGSALWPERWPLEELAKRKREVTEYDWSALYMGQPRPRGGALFREPTSYSVREMVDRIRGAVILISCDPAATAKTSADRSAIVVGAAKIGADGLPTMDVLDVKTFQVELPALVRELVAMQRAWRAPIAVEAVGGFKAVPQMLKAVDRGLRIIEIKPTADKFVRAQPVAAAWNDGRVFVPFDAPWRDDFVSEVCRFTGVADQKDDQVDALAHCWNALQKMVTRRRVPDAELQRLAPLG
jgi:predicted phage terminase large subunit-like protein